jgi:hypothetical protein
VVLLAQPPAALGYGEADRARPAAGRGRAVARTQTVETPAAGAGELTLYFPLTRLDRSFNSAIKISAALPQHRQDVIPPGQCLCQPAEMLIDLLLDRRIDAGLDGQIGNKAG